MPLTIDNLNNRVLSFSPEDRSVLVCSADGQGISNPDYSAELEAYFAHRDTDRVMRQRFSVCG